MMKMIAIFLLVFIMVYGFFHFIRHTPKEVVYNLSLKLLVALGAMVVASGVLFIFVQLF
jgi:hypothetical protein